MLGEIKPFMDGIQDDIMEKMTLEEVDELEYVKMCYQETMRRDAPAALSSTNTVLKTTTYDGVTF